MSAASGNEDADLDTVPVEFETDKTVLEPGLEVNAAAAESMDLE